MLRCWISAGFVQSVRRNTAQGSLHLHSGNLPSVKPLGCYRETSCTRTWQLRSGNSINLWQGSTMSWQWRLWSWASQGGRTRTGGTLCIWG